jgi:hypothetical protein
MDVASGLQCDGIAELLKRKAAALGTVILPTRIASVIRCRASGLASKAPVAPTPGRLVTAAIIEIGCLARRPAARRTRPRRPRL